ncbi:MAG: AmmeMemoRadiSam system protein B [Promethearchaeota archaeon]
MIRRASHAGSWYRGSKKDLIEALDGYFTDEKFGPNEPLVTSNKDERTIVGGVSPHAGMDYSGPCAAFTYLNLFSEKIPDTVIILGTDHVGFRKVALMEEGEWETPLGNLSIDEELSRRILENSKTVQSDSSLFVGLPAEQEHNIEIQLPFIKYCSLKQEVKIVPIKIAGTKDFAALKDIATGIAKAINIINKDVVVVASSDMSHKQVNDSNQLDKFKKIDLDVIEEFIKLNPENTLKNALKTSVCGPQTITTLLLICKNLNATKGQLLKYYTSSEKTGSIGGYCVGYFSGVLIK